MERVKSATAAWASCCFPMLLLKAQDRIHLLPLPPGVVLKGRQLRSRQAKVDPRGKEQELVLRCLELLPAAPFGFPAHPQINIITFPVAMAWRMLDRRSSSSLIVAFTLARGQLHLPRLSRQPLLAAPAAARAPAFPTYQPHSNTTNQHIGTAGLIDEASLACATHISEALNLSR